MELQELFDKQREFQDKIKSGITGGLNTQEYKNTMYREHCIFTIEEIIEGLREINHKPWKESKSLDDVDKLKDELIDEFRFFLNRCILVDMSPEEFIERFNKSIIKTNERFENGY